MTVQVVIAIVVGFVLGLLIAWFYWRQRVEERVDQAQDRIRDLTAQLQSRDLKLNQLEATAGERDTQIEGWKSHTADVEAKVQELQGLLGEKDQEIASLRAKAATNRVIEAPVPAIKPEPDNLGRIEGIGPKISQILQTAGITTFSQLASADVSQLEQILSDANLTLADPASWPEQANLAAIGNWSALETLQDELKGGRRVRPA